MAAQTDRGVPLSSLSPKFLNTNSTSHTWPFSAIAELIDNAYDPDVSAKQFWIDKTRIRDQDCLTFTDNGAGMDYGKMYKMLSFGFSEKEAKNGHVPVGLYGNGFKSGSMRLGKDAIVFSKNGECMCVGMLSQTYLQEIQAENIIVPIVRFRRIGESLHHEPQHTASFQDILRYSLFQTEEELLAEMEAINTHDSRESTGTRIIIWNLRKTQTDQLEFDFEVDRYDIQIPADVYESEKEKYKQPCHEFQSSPESDFSLRAYCSILYLKPRMQINICGNKVRTQLIAKSLACVVKDKYKPNFLNKESIPVTFGYNTKSKEHYGVMMYHKNRLIKAYERVGCQNRANNKGVGVIAVIECNFLKPTHNKQDFDYTEEYRRTMNTLGVKLEDYWKAIRHKTSLDTTVPVEDILKRPDQNWVQCDRCQKWRKLPDGIDTDKLPDKWFCEKNPNPQFRGCEKPEEAEDSDDETSTYLKTFKQHKRNLKKQQEQKKMQMEETMRQRNAELTEQNKVLRTTQENLLQGLRQSPSSPRSPLTPLRAVRTYRSPDSRSVPQSAPSQLDGMPVITEVTSLSPFARRRRNLENTESQALKKARTCRDYYNNIPDSPATSRGLPDVQTSQMEITHSNQSADKQDIENTSDDDVVIDETKSTQRPHPQTINLAKVKLESKTSNDMQGIEYVSMETSSTKASREATMTPSILNGQVSQTTQTECGVTVKVEEDQQIRAKEEMTDDERRERSAAGMEQSRAEADCSRDKAVKLNRSFKDVVETGRWSSADITTPNFAEGGDRKTETISPLPEKTASMNSISIGQNIDHISCLEAQKQQDELLDLLETTAQERDMFQKQAQTFEQKLLELTLKKECSHQNILTDASEEQDNATIPVYQYLEATQHIKELKTTITELKKQEEEMLLQMRAEKEAADRIKAQETSTVEDEIALQVDFLLRELDQRNTECSELKRKLENVKQERDCCEQLRKELEELKKGREAFKNEKGERGTDGSSSSDCNSESVNHVNQITEDRGTNERPVGGENTVTSAKLRELRRSVACLLVTFVPALDLEQINYDCEVIDEILNQVLQEVAPTESTST